MEHQKEEVLIEILQHHVPCSKESARRLLEDHQFNVVSVLNEIGIQIGDKTEYIEEDITVKGHRLAQTVKQLMKKSNLIHLSILKDDKIIISFPVTFSFIIFYLYPFLSTLTIAYFVRNEIAIKILRTKC